jgi:hypothetical protein
VASCHFRQPLSYQVRDFSNNSSSKAGRHGQQHCSAVRSGSHPAAAAEMRLLINGSNSSTRSYPSAVSLQEM